MKANPILWKSFAMFLFVCLIASIVLQPIVKTNPDEQWCVHQAQITGNSLHLLYYAQSLESTNMHQRYCLVTNDQKEIDITKQVLEQRYGVMN